MIPITVIVACGGSGGGSSSTGSTSGDGGGGSGTPIIVQTYNNDVVVAFQDGDGAWTSLAPAGDHTYSASVKDPQGRYGIALGRTTQNSYTLFQLTTSDATTVTEPRNTSEVTATGAEITQTFSVTNGKQQETDISLGGRLGGVGGKGTHTYSTKTFAGADAIGMLLRSNALSSTDLPLDFGQMMVARNLDSGSGPLSMAENGPGMANMQPFSLASGILRFALFKTADKRSWTHLPRRNESGNWSYLAPPAAVMQSGDEIVLHQGAFYPDGKAGYQLRSVLTAGASISGTAPSEIQLGSATLLPADSSRFSVTFDLPSDVTLVKIEGFRTKYGETLYISPKWLRNLSTPTYVTPTFAGVTGFEKFIGGTPNDSLSLVYGGNQFLDACSDLFLPPSNGPTLSQFGDGVKFAIVSKPLNFTP